MKADRISVLIVDDVAQTRTNITRLLQFETDIEVIGEAKDGKDAIKIARELRPNCILMDINMPEMDGIAATERIYQELPESVIIIISVQGEQEYLRKAMLAGARDYLVKPFSGNELANTIRQVWEMEQSRHFQQEKNKLPQKSAQVITVFSAKGGVGKTTIATNIAVSLAKENKDVILIDLDLQFGDVPIMMNLKVKRSMADWYSEGFLDIDDYLLKHNSGVKVLAAPEIPEEGELITAEHVSQLITDLQPLADYLIIDTPQFFQATTLQSLDLADCVLLVATPDLVNLKNVRRCLDVLGKLNIADKVQIVVNKVGKNSGLAFNQFNAHLNKSIWQQLPYDPRITALAVTQGIPVVNLNAKARLSRALIKLTKQLNADEPDQPGEAKGLKLLTAFAAKRG